MIVLTHLIEIVSEPACICHLYQRQSKRNRQFPLRSNCLFEHKLQL